MNVKEIQRKIRNLTVKKWRLSQDDNWRESERRRHRESYSINSVNRIKAQHRWNQANRIKTRIYNKRSYEKLKNLKQTTPLPLRR